MSKRIEQLAEQARDYARSHVNDCKHYGYHMEYNEFDLQFEKKFAELIVRECANLPFKSTGEVTTIGEIAVSNMILKHFGVE